MACDCSVTSLGRKLLDIDVQAAETLSRRRLQTWDENPMSTNISYLIISIFLVLMSGLMSGLTLGLLSLDHVEMEVLRRSGTPTQKR